MEDDRRIVTLTGIEEAAVIYLDSVVQVLIERYGLETASELFDEVTKHHTARGSSFDWTASFRAQIASIGGAVSGFLEHHKPL